jgi:hypothetical protein
MPRETRHITWNTAQFPLHPLLHVACLAFCIQIQGYLRQNCHGWISSTKSPSSFSSSTREASMSSLSSSLLVGSEPSTAPFRSLLPLHSSSWNWALIRYHRTSQKAAGSITQGTHQPGEFQINRPKRMSFPFAPYHGILKTSFLWLMPHPLVFTSFDSFLHIFCHRHHA